MYQERPTRTFGQLRLLPLFFEMVPRQVLRSLSAVSGAPAAQPVAGAWSGGGRSRYSDLKEADPADVYGI